MTLSVTHTKVSAVADDTAAAAAGEVLPSDWNASHTLTGTASAAQLNSSVVQSVVNDTNVTGSIANQVLTLGWTGRASSSRLPTDTAYIDVAQTWTADQYFKSGLPWFDVRAFGAKGDNLTDDSTAFANAIAAATTGGGIVYVPNGNYKVLSGVTIAGSVSIALVGAGYNTEINVGSADVVCLTINNGRHLVRDLVLVGSQTLATTKACISIGSAATETKIDHVLAVGGQYVLKNAGGDISLNDCNFSQAYGAGIILNQNASGAQFWGKRLKVDQAYPVSTPPANSTFAARANTTGYTAGTVVSSGGYYIQCKTTGTSGGSPPTLLPYNTDITDGSVVWRLVGSTSYAAIILDTGSSSVTMNDVDMTGSFVNGLLLSNSLAGTAPQGTVITDSFVGTCYAAGIQLAAGSGTTIKGCQITNMLGVNAPAIQAVSPYAGDAMISNCLIFASPFGILLNTATNFSITGCNIFGASGAAIYVAGGQTRFTIAGNNLGQSATWGTNAIGIQLAAGATDFGVIVGNVTNGATTEFSNGATGTHNWFQTPSTLSTAAETVLSNGNVGFGTETNPQYQFVLSQNTTTGLNPVAVNGAVLFNSTGTSSFGYNAITYASNGAHQFFRIDGTPGSPSNLGSGESLGVVGFGGWGNGAIQGARARIAATSTEAWTTTFGASLEFDTTAAGAGARAQAMLLKGGVIIGTGTTDPGSGAALLTPVTVATLPAASSSLKGAVASVSDGTAALAWGATVTGGGSTPYLVYCNGTAWTVAGK